MSPNSPANRCRGPGSDVRRIIDAHANDPAVIIAAVPGVSGVSHIHDPVYESQSTALFLDEGIESDAIVNGGGVHVHGPAWVRRACVHIQRIDKMLLGWAVD